MPASLKGLCELGSGHGAAQLGHLEALALAHTKTDADALVALGAHDSPKPPLCLAVDESLAEGATANVAFGLTVSVPLLDLICCHTPRLA